MNNKIFIIFDLDDTLYKEINFLKSAYLDIALMITPKTYMSTFNKMMEFYYSNQNVFEKIIKYTKTNYTKQELLNSYRNHLPNIELKYTTQILLKYLIDTNISLGLITDGRSIQQRNKLKALSIENYFKDIIISEEFGSEKPSALNYQYFENKYQGFKFCYIGDNLKKDFVIPNQLGWDTICLKDNGENIHSQNIDISDYQKAKYFISDLYQITKILKL